MLLPIMVLVLWTLFMLGWMLAIRIPAIIRMRLKLDSSIPQKDLMTPLPSIIRWKAENYNHLLEQPTIFYVTAIVGHLMDPANELNVVLAWSYVTSRIVHSLWQSCWNVITIRFAIFIVSSLILLAMAGNTALMLLNE